jgi:hypothetical protein
MHENTNEVKVCFTITFGQSLCNPFFYKHITNNLFLVVKFWQKGKLRIKKSSYFGVFQLPKVRKTKSSKNC